jgi:iron complex outermembrane recepter protein
MRRFHAIVWLLVLHVSVAAQQPSDLTAISLEDLLNVEVVSVRKSSQKLSRTPAAVFVITQSDIRRSGAASLPEALRLAPGIHVARVSGTVWAIGMRGFNTINSDKLLVMIDGRTVYNPVLSGVVWCTQIIPLEDVERIEVIRGPAGSMWGANAVTGVINVITFKASATQGALVSASGGLMDPARTTFRYGSRRGENLAWRSWFHHETLGQANVGDLPTLSPWNTGRAGVRIDWERPGKDQVVVESEVMGLRTGWNVHHYSSHGQVAKLADDGGAWGGFLLGQWIHVNRRGDTTKLQAYEDIRSTNLGFARFGTQTSDLDVQHSIQSPRGHSILLGGGFRSNRITTAGTQSIWFEPANRTYFIPNVFVQDDWELLHGQLVLTAGAKLERYTLAGPALQPSVRLMWTPTAKQGYWVAASKAVRVPSAVDHAVRYPRDSLGTTQVPIPLLFMGEEAIRPERLHALETGSRWQLCRRGSIELSLFYNRFLGLHAFQTQVPMTPEGIGGALFSGLRIITGKFVNGLNARSRGGEVNLHFDVTRKWRILGSYSTALRAMSLSNGYQPRDTFEVDLYYPRQMVQVRSSWEFGRWSVDAEAYRVDKLTEPGKIVLPAYTRVDLRLERKINDHVSMHLTGRNLLRPHQQEYITDVLFGAGRIGRSVSIGVRWER